MCNLAGWVGTLERKKIESLMLQSCGVLNDDATGVALHLGNKISILKAPVPATKFINGRWRKWYGEKANSVLGGLVHTRLATNGSPQNNVNNHPHVSERGSILVHKGIIQSKEVYPSRSECDSEQLLHAIDDKGLRKGITSCSGWASIAYIDGLNAQIVWLYNNKESIKLYRGDDCIIFATCQLYSFGNPIISLTEGQWFGLKFEDRRFIWGPKAQLLNPMPVVSYNYYKDYGQNYDWFR